MADSRQTLGGVLNTDARTVGLAADGGTQHGRVGAGVDVVGHHATSFRPVVGGAEKNNIRVIREAWVIL